MRPLSAMFRIFPLLIGLCGVGTMGAALAQDAQTYTIAANDGYGLQECLSGGVECGQVVADAWCEAHGHAKALSFGPASHFASAAFKGAASAESYVISCGG